MPKVERHAKEGRIAVRVQKQHANIKEGKSSPTNEST
jgi:hypothetical protein